MMFSLCINDIGLLIITSIHGFTHKLATELIIGHTRQSKATVHSPLGVSK